MKRAVGFLVLIAAFVFVKIYFFSPYKKDTYLEPKTTTEKTSLHYAFYANKGDYGNIEQKNRPQEIQEKIYGGIVSHHLLAGDQIGEFFAELKNRDVKTVVIIGPNHYGVGKANVLTSQDPYKTPWGTVIPDLAVITQLTEQKSATIDETPFTKEHSISALVSYVAVHLPEAHLVPIIIKSGTNIDSLDKLTKNLINILPDDAVVIASVDFSHHLNRTAAFFHDDMTLSALENFDYERLFKAEVDSPPSLYVLLRYLESRGAQNMHYKRVNAADLLGNMGYDDVTSYVFAHFTAGKPQRSKTVTTLNFGDMMFDRGVKHFMDGGGDPFSHIRGVEAHFLKGVDMILANLEGPITERTECQKKAYSFRFSPTITKILKHEGFDGVNLANNHSLDCFRQGFLDTRNYLKSSSLDAFGSRNVDEGYITKEIGGTNVVLMGIDETGSSDIDLGAFYKKITELKKTDQHIIVHIHWGFEYDTKPSARQIEIGHKLIESGADVVIGHHPHVIQPIEIYRGGAIFYSLGNFIFDQSMPETKQGFGVGTVYKDGNMGFYLFPYVINNFQPTLMPNETMQKFCDEILKNMSKKEVCHFEI